MRITGGLLRGRILEVPGGGLRPTQDKVRAALFSMLGAGVVEARVLDLFAGSGAMGLEAWSRGAESVCWVESDRRVFSVLQKNVRELCADPGRPVRCVCSEVFSFLRRHEPPAPFMLVLADPPYDREGQYRWLEKTLPALESHSMLAPGGWLGFEQSAGEPVIERPGWSLLRDRTYGSTRLLLYRRESVTQEEGSV